MTDNALQSGTVISNGRYRILSVLGRGGFGITYLVENLQTNRRMAMKELFPADLCGREGNDPSVRAVTSAAGAQIDSMKAKFIKEASTLMQLDHEGIVKVYDLFEENGTAYYVMDYLQGRTLDDVIREDGVMSHDKAIKVIDRVADALQYVHNRRLNHLDVKPTNIILRDDTHEVVLIDFGLSKRYDRHGRQTSNTPVGISKGYAPLEQYSGDGVATFSPETDIYSLCATLYYLLSGIDPPEAVELVSRSLPRPFEISDQNLWMIILKGMAANPDFRFHSMQELRGALMSTLQTAPVQRVDNGYNGGYGDNIPPTYNNGGYADMPDNGMQPKVARIPTPGAPVMRQPAKMSGSKTLKWILIGAAILIGLLLLGAMMGGDDSAPAENNDASEVEEEIVIDSTANTGSSAEANTTAPQDIQQMTLSGTIGGDDNAQLSLTPDGGHYTFLGAERSLTVENYEPSTGKLELGAYDGNNNYIGTFRGILQQGTKVHYTGTFTNTKNHSIDFSLSEL